MREPTQAVRAVDLDEAIAAVDRACPRCDAECELTYNDSFGPVTVLELDCPECGLHGGASVTWVTGNPDV
jgi:ribosomal protein S27AE